ncbi:DNA adenine modification methylase [Microbulbifer epialgicus]|uniref:DNA adenine modification methylase n=1 Tax=Microbulbifer epialgicus TaxID=393907 RepID=A0ABV4NU78_9GAMM
MFKSSVISYPNRGNYGDSRYRGNCSGYVIKDFLETYGYQDGLFVDPSEGGGTSRDVANELGVRYIGLDLSKGFNLCTDDLYLTLGERASTIFWHSPYWRMIPYSGKNAMWGNKPHPFDLSHASSLQDFLSGCQLAISNIYDALRTKGTYGILIGNWRHQGEYYNLSSMLERLCPGKLVDEIIKVQHNCVSDRKTYRGSHFVRIAHEKLLVFQKANELFGFALAYSIQKRIELTKSITWKSAVKRILMSNGGPMALAEIYMQAEPYIAQTNNNHPHSKIRQILQDSRYFRRVERGVFDLVREAA